MPDNKVTVTPIGHRAHWARSRTEFDPPEGDNMQGASEPQPSTIASPTTQRACQRFDRAMDEFIAAAEMISKLAQLAPTPVDRAMLQETVNRNAARMYAVKL